MGTSRKETKIAILGGGDEELSVLSEFHRTAGVRIIGIYDPDPRAVALEIAEILSIPTFSDDSFVRTFVEADYILATEKRKRFERELEMLGREHKSILDPVEAAGLLASSEEIEREDSYLWPQHLEEALKYIERVTDRERMLKWLLDVAVRAVEATTGSIMLYSPETRELYIGYASGLSEEIVSKCRQRLGEGIAGEVAEKREAKLTENLVDTPLYKGSRERSRIQSSISAPIVNEGKLLGVLNVSTDIGEKRLEGNDLRTIVALADRIAIILDKHLRIDEKIVRDLEFQIRQYIETLFGESLGFHERFDLLCKFLASKLSAQTVTIYTATDDGNWLILGGSDQQVAFGEQYPRIFCNGGSLTRAYLDGEEITLTQTSSEAGNIEKAGKGPITAFYMPLFHNERVGVLVVEFAELSAFETFMRLKSALRFQVSLFVHALVREARQGRKLRGLEDLASLVPAILSIDSAESRLKRLSEFLSALVKASCGSIYDIGPRQRKVAYYRYPEEDSERRRYLECDSELIDTIRKKGEPVCIGYFSRNFDIQRKQAFCRSIIAFPIYIFEDRTILYIGYDKVPVAPLDAAVFGSHDISLLEKVRDLTRPLFATAPSELKEKSSLGFDELLRYNQQLMMERIREEIERAERYHHAFVLTAFKLVGLGNYLNEDSTSALVLVNELSKGVRLRIRKTDFFSWVETDTFVILSIEEHSRMTFLEERVESFVEQVLSSRGLYDPRSFFLCHGYAIYPGDATTANDLMNTARSRIEIGR